MSFIHLDRNLEQMLIPISVIRGGTSQGFYFEGKNVPPRGKGLEEFLLAVRGSPDPMGMDGLGGILQSKAAVGSPSSRPNADVDYTFIQIFPDQPCRCSKTYPITEGAHPRPRQSALSKSRAALLTGEPDMGALRNEWKETDLAEATARSTIAVAQAARRSYR